GIAVKKSLAPWLLAGIPARSACSTKPTNAHVGAGVAVGHEIGKRIQ
ncbi:MAG: hypothetical protein H6R21_280, partial [Proteobacteria bacterium]|nr:hypothetical protein [Pseudomonadota bacterium]